MILAAAIIMNQSIYDPAYGQAASLSIRLLQYSCRQGYESGKEVGLYLITGGYLLRMDLNTF